MEPKISNLASNQVQYSFDPLNVSGVSEEEAHAIAKAARDAKYSELRKAGVQCRRSVLRGQLRAWADFGVPDGRVRDVYELTAVRA